jgi:hypothetical protein
MYWKGNSVANTGASALSQQDWDAIGAVVAAAVQGPFIDDGEFETLFGVDRNQAAEVLANWPPADDQEQVAYLTINDSFVNLLGYPHGKMARLEAMTGLAAPEIASLFQRWRASHGGSTPTDYFSDLA